MLKRSLTVIIVFILNILLLGASASFDCRQASTQTEKMICANPELSDADGRLGKTFKKLQTSLPKSQLTQLQQEQREWLTQRDQYLLEECWKDTACAVQFYEERIAELETKMSVGDKVYGTVVTALNVRKGMGADTPVVGKVEQGSTLQILEDFGKWYQVVLKNGQVGYVKSDDLQLNESSSPLRQLSSQPETASFDCSLARTPAEKFICSHASLREADGRLGKVYAQLQRAMPKSQLNELKQEQQAWLKHRDYQLKEVCVDDVECAVRVYEERMDELATQLKKIDGK